MIVSNWDKERLLRSTILAGFFAAGLATAPAMAQDADEPETTEEEQEEAQEAASGDRIVVTGSRIGRSEFTAVSPIQVVSGELSRDLGLVDADDILSQTTVIQGIQTDLGVSTTLQPTQAFTTFGSVTPSLRGLASSITGRSRNLVLINGRRYGPVGVGGAPANPDVSLIPGSMIQRVEVLLDGASSVYGSDAIAGVVNYILRDDFEGLELSAYNSTPNIGDGRQYVYSALVGTSSDRGRFVAALEYNSVDDITKVDRADLTGRDQLSGQNLLCDPEMEINTLTGEIFRSCSSFLAGFGVFGPFGSVAPTPGTTNIGIPGWSNINQAPINQAGTFGPVWSTFTQSHPADQEATVTPQTERFTFYMTGGYDLDLYTAPEFYFEFNYSERNLQSTFFNQGVLEVEDDSPGNPGLGSMLMVPLLRVETNQNIDVLRGVGGLRGDLPFMDDLFGGAFGNFSYDTSVLFHRSRGTQRFYGNLRTDNTARVLTGEFDANGTFVCGLDQTTPSPGRPGASFFDPPTNCFPANFFDPQFVLTGRFADPRANDFILAESIQTTQVDQLTLQGVVTGDLFAIPTGGIVSTAFGVEYREDFIRTVNDPLTRLPNSIIGQNTDLGSNGRRSLIEGFGELSIPIVEGRQFVERLQLDLAARYTEEEFFGSDWTYQIKGEWAPFTWASLSAGFGTSFRAPDTGEQFGTGTAFAINTRADPCLPSTNTLETDPNTGLIFYDETQDERDQAVKDICAQLGVALPTGPNDAAGALALGLFGIGTPSGSFQNFQVLLRNGGSIDVGPETSEALFIKATVEQPWFDAFSFRGSVNYFEYEVSDSIGQLTQGLILSTCFDPAEIAAGNRTVTGVGQIQGELCNFQQRDPVTGLLIGVNEASFNLGSITSRGIDFNAAFNADLDQIPQIGEYFVVDGSPINLDLNYRATWSLENAEDITGNGTFTDNLGEFGFPEFQANVTTTLRWRDLALLHRYRFSTSTDNGLNPFGGGNVCTPVLLERDPNADTSGCTEYIDLPDLELHSLTAVYARDTWVFRAGIENLLDEVVVRDVQIPGDAGTGTPFGLGYSLTGRSFFASITKSF
jgi:iron complex outermembrane receptor protein